MLIYFIILLAIISRFVPHMPNFAPITALAIFAAAYLPWKKAAGITFAARLISDIFLGFVSWPMMLAIYASHGVGILLGLWIKHNSSVIPESRGFASDIRNPELNNSAIALDAKPGSRILFGGTHNSGMTKTSWFRIFTSSLVASAIFFLVTNFAFLYSNYPHNLNGIIQAYINGLPFLRGTLMGDMFYSIALFGGYALAVKSAGWRTKRRVAQVQ
jgi:hypothetical protein